MDSGIESFLVRRSLAAGGVLFAILVILAVIINTGVCAGIDWIIAQNREEIEADIARKEMLFPSPEAQEAYVNQTIQSELAACSLDICSHVS